jgi:hypothetical protein
MAINPLRSFFQRCLVGCDPQNERERVVSFGLKLETVQLEEKIGRKP